MHTEGLEGTIDKLLDAGIFLSQITVLHAPAMQSVNVSIRDNLEYPTLEWNKANSNQTHQTGITDTLTVGEHVKALLVL